MYILFDTFGKIIGCHDNYDVVEEYQDNLKLQQDIESRIEFMKDKKAVKKFKDILEDMELTAYKQTYIPRKYVDYIVYAGYDTKDLQFCKDILISLYSSESLSKREEKNLKKTIYLLDDIISENNSYTPSLKELETLKNHYDEIMSEYNYNLYENEH